MAKLARTPFIHLVTLGYCLLALGWILLSDNLLALFDDRDAILLASHWKGGLFVLVTSVLLYLALRAVPPPPHAGSGAALEQLGSGPLRRPRRRCFACLFALAISLAALGLRQSLDGLLDGRPLLILFILPIALGALLGGLLPGLLATLVTSLGVTVLFLAPVGELAIAAQAERLQLFFFVLIGSALSLIIELLRRTREGLDFHRRLLDAIVSGSEDAIFVKDRNGRYLLGNHAAARFVGRSLDAFVGRRDAELFAAPSAALIAEHDAKVLASRQVHSCDEVLESEQGARLVFSVSRGPLFDESGAVYGLFGIARDITERQRSELAQREAAAVFESSYEGIMVLDAQRQIVRVNPAFTRITGYSADEALGRAPLWLAADTASVDDTPWQLLQIQGVWSGEVWSRRKNGECYAQLLSLSRVPSHDGSVQHYVGLFSDISALKNHQSELDRAAHYDPLTGLPNRRLLGDRLEQAIAHAQRSGKSLAVCQFDLDDFRQINERHGHAAGDQMLRGMAGNLRALLRADDTLAHLGGDSFVLLLGDLDSARECASTLARVQAAIATPQRIAGSLLHATASIGVTLFPADSGDGDALLRHADQAMFLAKEAGKNRYQLFDPESERKAREQRGQLERLRLALARDEFVLHYQPKVDLADGRVIGVEALIRWQAPELGLLAPGAFLPLIEGIESLEREVGDWVLASALAQLEQWQQAGLALAVSVNISAHQLMHGDFAASLQRLLERHPQVPRARLELEILETAALTDMQRAIAVMQRCAALGVRFALDDFGTGYSSLTYLRQLPVDTLKIDQSFVRDMLVDPDDRAIVDGVIRLAAAFHRQVIAEGVETREHGQALQQLGCRLAQGYGIARPMPAEQLPAWLHDWQRDWQPSLRL